MNKEIAFLFFLQTTVIYSNNTVNQEVFRRVVNRIGCCCKCEHFIVRLSWREMLKIDCRKDIAIMG